MVVARNTNFDEAVNIQFAVDFFNDSVCQAVGAEKDDRVKVMRLGSKCDALVPCEF